MITGSAMHFAYSAHAQRIQMCSALHEQLRHVVHATVQRDSAASCQCRSWLSAVALSADTATWESKRLLQRRIALDAEFMRVWSLGSHSR